MGIRVLTYWVPVEPGDLLFFPVPGGTVIYVKVKFLQELKLPKKIFTEPERFRMRRFWVSAPTPGTK